MAADWSRKRTRDQEADRSPERRPRLTHRRVRDPDLWFEDGNVLLIAQDVEFLVYAGLLTKHSPVFRDMLSLPQPAPRSGAQKISEVELSDHPNDVRRLLSSMILGNDFRFVNHSPHFRLISSLIRMGHKYQIDAAVKIGTDYLLKYYPADFATWKNQRQGAPLFTPLEHIGVVNLARLIRADDILPAAFMHCCSVDPAKLVKGFEREEGVFEKLSYDDLTRALIARGELIKADAHACVYALEPGVSCCDTSDYCSEVLHGALWHHIAEDEDRSMGLNWHKMSWADYFEYLEPDPCEECLDLIREREAEMLKELWDRWPDILGV